MTQTFFNSSDMGRQLFCLKNMALTIRRTSMVLFTKSDAAEICTVLNKENAMS